VFARKQRCCRKVSDLRFAIFDPGGENAGVKPVDYKGINAPDSYGLTSGWKRGINENKTGTYRAVACPDRSQPTTSAIARMEARFYAP
jgi:hypothetical protein